MILKNVFHVYRATIIIITIMIFIYVYLYIWSTTCHIDIIIIIIIKIMLQPFSTFMYITYNNIYTAKTLSTSKTCIDIGLC